MAFNPFRNFQKNQKYWMAAILLMCMLTFVLCTGVQGDLGARLLELFNANRAAGEPVLEISNRTVRYRELEDLKARRNIADEFMKQLMKYGIERFKEILTENQKQINELAKKDKAAADKRAVQLQMIATLQKDLIDRLSQPRYFETGTRLEDLSNFLTWLELANKMDIQLSPENVRDLVYTSVHGIFIGFEPGHSRKLQESVRQQHYNATDDVILRALTDEFRVQIAKLAGLECRTALLMFGQRNPDKLLLDSFPKQTRFPLTPEQLFAYHVKTRSEATLDVLPVALDALAKSVPEPTEAQVQAFFKAHAKKKYDPNSEQPGFTMPKKIQVGVLMPKEPAFQRSAEAVTALMAAPVPTLTLGQPVLALAYTRLGRDLRTEAFDTSLQRDLENLSKPGRPGWERYYFQNWTFQGHRKTEASKGVNFTDARYRLYFFLPAVSDREALAMLAFKNKLLNNPFGTYPDLGKEQPKLKPTTVASIVGVAGGISTLGPMPAGQFMKRAYFDDVISGLEKQWAPVLKKEEQGRAELTARLVGLSAPTTGPLPNGLSGLVDPKATMVYSVQGEVTTHPMPGQPGQPLRRVALTGPVRERLIQDQIVKKLAQKWITNTMLAVEKQLTDPTVKGDNFKFNRDVVPALVLKYPLDYKTTLLFDQYQATKVPALLPLRDEFDRSLDTINLTEGRAGTPRQLRDVDFYKLFFADEAFSVGNVAPYIPREWPPRITAKRQAFETLKPGETEKRVDLFRKAERPMLFWKISEQAEQTPTTLTPELRPEVIKAWKRQEARKKVAENLKAMTAALRGRDSWPELRGSAGPRGQEGRSAADSVPQGGDAGAARDPQREQPARGNH